MDLLFPWALACYQKSDEHERDGKDIKKEA